MAASLLLLLFPSTAFAHGGLIFPHVWQVRMKFNRFVGKDTRIKNSEMEWLDTGVWCGGSPGLEWESHFTKAGLRTIAFGQDVVALDILWDEGEQNRGSVHDLEAMGVVHQRHPHSQEAGQPILDACHTQNKEWQPLAGKQTCCTSQLTLTVSGWHRCWWFTEIRVGLETLS